MKSNFRSYLIAFTASLGLMQSGCGTTTGNPVTTTRVQLSSGSFVARHWFELIPSAYASVSSVKLCFKRLRFKTGGSDPLAGSGNIDFYPGEVRLTTTGNTLGAVSIPIGVYRRVEFDLEKNCPGSTSGNSVDLSNSHGTYASQDSITIKFEGTFVASEENQNMTLMFQNLVSALDTVLVPNDIKAHLEDSSVVGTF